MPSVTFLGEPDHVLGWDGQHAYLTGDVAAGTPPPTHLDGIASAVQFLGRGEVRIFRDRLGLGKLFWVRREDGTLILATRPAHLVNAGRALDDVIALPRGRIVTLNEHGRLVSDVEATSTEAKRTFGVSLAETGAQIRKALDSYLSAIAAACPGRRIYLCLSGGLDSSTVAVLARRHFASLTAVSFDLIHPGRPESEDRTVARRLATDLGIPMIEVNVIVEKLLLYLDLVLIAGIDWRDFNVHCGLVNAALADVIAQDSRHRDASPLVITGDLHNEFLVDYHAEVYKGKTYYELPRLDVTELRKILVQGLDTCHREVGVFGAFGLPVVQPFAACLDIYLKLPAAFLRQEDRKDRLVREIVGSQLPDYIYQRPKVRAQIGDTHGGGTLAACIDNGIDSAWLRNRFATLHEVGECKALNRFIRAGRFRSAIPV